MIFFVDIRYYVVLHSLFPVIGERGRRRLGDSYDMGRRLRRTDNGKD